MTKASDNEFPSLLVKEGTAPSSPAAGDQRLFIDSSDHLLKYKNSSGTVSSVGGGLTDPMTTRGDIIVRNSSNTTARLAIGAAGKILSSDGTDISWGLGPLTTKGDLIATTGSALNRLAVGSDGQVLTADAASTNGIKWAAAGGGGVTVQYPGLKPGSPTDDFAAASLSGSWSAHSNQGSFATANCITQGEDWIGSSLDMQFSAQNGTIYRTHADTDLDFTVGGIRQKGIANASGTQMMIGIAALNSSGTGVGVTIYDDGNAYIATITTYNYSAFSDSWSGHGKGTATGMDGDWWLRLKRVSGTWTGYASQSGRAWDKTFSTRADSITVAQLHFGILFSTGTAYSGRLIADYFQLDA